jgi:5-methyltetrahydropteroyltriglutamate--homocysteine methyltransferase
MAKEIYRCEQVGSLLRPPHLLDARDAFRAHNISREALRREEDAAVIEVLARQQQAGFSIFVDGEMRRDAWQSVFMEAVDGFVEEYPTRIIERPDGTKLEVEVHNRPVRGKLRAVRRLAGTDAAFLKQHSPGPFKITLPSAGHISRASYRPGITDTVYPRRIDLLRDATSIVRDEMIALVKDGTPYIQVDEGFVYHITAHERCDAATAEKELADDIAAENECYDAVKSDDVIVAMHLCRGSRVAWLHGPGHYDWLAERLFDTLHVDRFILEYDTDVCGGFEPLRFIPKGKIAVLGLVSSKVPRLETRDELMRRIDEASKYCPVDQLALTSQCGFQAAADRDGAHIDFDSQWRKLELIVETAREVWG